MNRKTEADRFWEKVKKGEKDNECWLWTACINGGYGHFGLQTIGPKGTKVKLITAHRWAYINLVGPIPEGLILHHTCNTRHCVNPQHLLPTLQKDNVRIGSGPTAVNSRKTHCSKGHPLSGNNLYRHKDGRRECKTCSRNSNLASYHRRFGKNIHTWKKRKYER